MAGLDNEAKCVFALGLAEDGRTPMVVLAVPDKAWEHMKDGKTHTFDFSAAGLPVQIMMFGCRTQEEALAVIHEANKMPSFKEDLKTDYGIKEPTKQ